MSHAALNNVLKKLDTKKAFKGRVYSGEEVPNWDSRSSGILGIDVISGIGGLPKGGQVEIWGSEGSAKTTLAMNWLAQIQRDEPDGIVAFIDVERTFTKSWAETNGIDMDRLLYVQPLHTENASDLMNELTKSPDVKAVVFDSVGQSISHAELEGDADQANFGGSSKTFGRMSKKVAQNIDGLTGTGCTVIWINQVRDNMSQYGDKHIRPGGRILEHNIAMRIKLRVDSQSKRVVADTNYAATQDNKRKVGVLIKATIQKNKCGAGNKATSFWYMFDPSDEYGSVGIDLTEHNMRVLMASSLIQQSGSWFSYNGVHADEEIRAQGKDSFIEAVLEVPGLIESLMKELLNELEFGDDSMDVAFAEPDDIVFDEEAREGESLAG